MLGCHFFRKICFADFVFSQTPVSPSRARARARVCVCVCVCVCVTSLKKKYLVNGER